MIKDSSILQIKGLSIKEQKKLTIWNLIRFLVLRWFLEVWWLARIQERSRCIISSESISFSLYIWVLWWIKRNNKKAERRNQTKKVWFFLFFWKLNLEILSVVSILRTMIILFTRSEWELSRESRTSLWSRCSEERFPSIKRTSSEARGICLFLIQKIS